MEVSVSICLIPLSLRDKYDSDLVSSMLVFKYYRFGILTWHILNLYKKIIRCPYPSSACFLTMYLWDSFTLRLVTLIHLSPQRVILHCMNVSCFIHPFAWWWVFNPHPPATTYFFALRNNAALSILVNVSLWTCLRGLFWWFCFCFVLFLSSGIIGSQSLHIFSFTRYWRLPSRGVVLIHIPIWCSSCSIYIPVNTRSCHAWFLPSWRGEMASLAIWSLVAN